MSCIILIGLELVRAPTSTSLICFVCMQDRSVHISLLCTFLIQTIHMLHRCW